MRALLVVAVFTAAASSSAFGITEDPAAPAGFELPRGADVDALPLRAQTTTVDVAGVVARIRIEQVWVNAGKVPLAATYVFPTSTRAALHDLRLRINDQRELRAEIRVKEQAQKLYDAARDNGQTAALLEQQRPNAVTMNVANILPGDRIVVVVEASELLRSVEGIYELVLPQTLGPRYTGAARSERGSAASVDDGFVDNGFVSAASSTVQTRIEVTVRSPIGVKRIGSPSHGISPLFDGKDEAKVVVASSADDVVADRDLVLRWQLAGDDNETGVLLFRDKERGESFFLLLGEAPADVDADDATAREVVFVVDVSGSMSGFPLDTAKGLVRDLVGELRGDDRFNMLFFAGSSTVLAPTSLAPSASNIARALDTLDRHSGGGGTELGEAMRTALALPVADDGVDRARVVVVVTDGFVSTERAVFDDVRDHVGDASVFAFGIGSSVNRDLIEGLAHAGHTEPFVMLDAAQGQRAVDHFRVNVGRPSLTHIDVRFDGFAATDVEPARAPDVFPGRPLVMLGKFSGPSSGNVVVTGTGLRGAPYRNVIAVEDHLEKKEHAPLSSLWARARVARLADTHTPTPQQLADVEALGLRYRLLTERTSFVVVDPAVRNGAGDFAAVAQPQLLPQGVRGDPSSALFGTAAGVGGLSGLNGGSAGLGTRGAGVGGGGLGVGFGRSSHVAGAIDLGGRGKGGTRIVPGKIIYEGGLSREEIQRVISRSMSQIKYCYEKELTRTPALAGKLVLRWQIAGDGTVRAVTTTENTLAPAGSAAVAQCAQRLVSRLTFPAPKGGGTVNVTYPFVFSTAP